jgi:rubrerythrin
VTWVYLDDGFYDSDKVQLAGGDAGWLYVCALCYCRRKKNGGIFPRNTVPQLSDRKNPAGLARKLVEVGLWEEMGEAYYAIHDYDEWNKLAEDERRVRSEKAKRAALARWHGDAPPDAHGMPDGCPPDAQEHAPPDARTDAQPMPSPNTPSGVRQSSTHVGSDAQASPKLTTTTDETLEQTWEILAERDRQAKVAETGVHPRNRTAWLASAAKQRRSRHEADARRILEAEPTTTAEQLAESLEPVEVGVPRPKAFDAQERCPECVNGWLENDDGTTVRCPSCRAAS